MVRLRSDFLRMLDQIGTLKETTSFHFWLFKIAGNSLRNFVRDKARSREGFEDFAGKARKESESSAFWVRGSFEPSPEARLMVSERVERRRRILLEVLRVIRLAPQTFQSLLRRLRGESYEEIAQSLGIPVGTARSHVSRARATVYRHLEEIDAEDLRLDDLVPDATAAAVADLSPELLTFKREALEADPAYHRAGILESGGARDDRAEPADEDALTSLFERTEDVVDEDEVKPVSDSPEEIAAVISEDRARGRSRRRPTRAIAIAGHGVKEPALGRLEKEDLGYPMILLEEAAAFLANGAVDSGRGLALKAKLTCAGSLLARGRRFKTARRVEEMVAQAMIRLRYGPGEEDERYGEIRHRVAEGCALLCSFLGFERKGGEARRTTTDDD